MPYMGVNIAHREHKHTHGVAHNGGDDQGQSWSIGGKTQEIACAFLSTNGPMR